MAQRRKIFNLLKPIEPPLTAWDKVYLWIVNRARVVILITELLISFAFVGKVIEDTSAKNKEKMVDKLVSELKFYAVEQEPFFRNIQRKGGDYIKVWNSSSGYYSILNEIYSYIPDLPSDLTVRISDNRVSIFGNESLSTLKTLEEAMKKSKTFTAVFIDTLSLEQQQILEKKAQYVLVADIDNFFRKPI